MNDKIGALYHEAVSVGDVLENGREVFALDVVGAAALIANEVVMLAWFGDLKVLPLRQPAGLYEAQALQYVQGAIDGRHVDRLLLPAESRPNLVGAQVATGPANGVPDELPLPRQPIA
jgi:hypothetical protein